MKTRSVRKSTCFAIYDLAHSMLLLDPAYVLLDLFSILMVSTCPCLLFFIFSLFQFLYYELGPGNDL